MRQQISLTLPSKKHNTQSNPNSKFWSQIILCNSNKTIIDSHATSGPIVVQIIVIRVTYFWRQSFSVLIYHFHLTIFHIFASMLSIALWFFQFLYCDFFHVFQSSAEQLLCKSFSNSFRNVLEQFWTWGRRHLKDWTFNNRTSFFLQWTIGAYIYLTLKRNILKNRCKLERNRSCLLMRRDVQKKKVHKNSLVSTSHFQKKIFLFF